MPMQQVNAGGTTRIKTLCPYCDVFFIIALLLATAALSLSLMQSIFGVLAVVIFIITLGNCFFQSKTKRLGMILAGILECSFGGYCFVHILNIESQCDPETFRYLPCSLKLLAITGGLWMLSGLFILYFVYSGRVREYIKEGLEIEAVATPLGSVEELGDDLELGEAQSGDSFDSEWDSERDSEADCEGDSEEDQDYQDRSLEQAAATATICIIPDDDGMSEERKAKLAQSVPLTPATPVDSSERSTRSYLPNGTRERTSSS